MTSLRYALRGLSRSPAFVAIAVLALGTGLGLSTTMFAVLDAVVNPYLPYRDPDNLFDVAWWYNTRNGMISSRELYRAVRQETGLFAAVIPVSYGRQALETADDSRDVGVSWVRPDYFTVTGVRPIRGRAFVRSDGEDVALVGEDVWRRALLRRSLEGATIVLGGRTLAVVGVMPRGSAGSVWLPLAADTGAIAGSPLVRLRAGVTREQVNEALETLGARLTTAFSTRDNPIRLELRPVRARSEQLRDVHKAMVGAALAVLIIACVNLAHLMLARGLSKRRELALRMALGASRAAVVRQMFAECAIITLAGALLGGLGAIWGADILTNRMTPEVGWVGLMQPQLSWRVFALSALAAVTSAIAFGLLPAIRVARSVSLDEPLKDGAGTTSRARQRYSPLVVIEVALALALMMGGGLLLRTVQQLRSVEYSFDQRTLARAMIGLKPLKDSTSGFTRDGIVGMVAAVPGVRDVAWEGYVRPPGNAVTAEMVTGDPTATVAGGYAQVSWPYFRVHGLPIIEGRDFTVADEAAGKVAILNAAAAQRLYPHGHPVGKMLKLAAPHRDGPWVPIVGIARTPMSLGHEERPVEPMVWVVGADRPVSFGWLLIRTSDAGPRTPVAVRRKLHAIPNIWVSSVERYDAQRTSQLVSRAFLAQVFVTMGAVAMALAALGLHGVLAYAVNQRMREFAVRIALGASPRQLFRMVMHDGLVMLLAGIGAGAFVALFASRTLDAVLSAVLPSDVVSLVASELVLISVGLAAALVPARRALRANPLDILRAV